MPVPDLPRVRAALDLARPLAGEATARVVYRLLYVELARQRGVTVSLQSALASLGVPAAPELKQALALLRVDASPTLAEPRALGDLHQALLPAEARRAAGAYFTPQPLIDLLLDEALEPALDETEPQDVVVLDPSCGSGLFLVSAAHRFARRGVPVERILGHCLHGVDLDDSAVELARISLWLTAVDLGGPPSLPTPSLRVGDALLEPARDSYDVVIGNPPFLNRLERRTAPDADTARRLAAESGGVVRPYTDISAVFLHRAASCVRPGGRIALVQPQSLLAARDAAGVRADLAGTCSLDSLWSCDRPVFDAGVLTCAPVLRRGGTQGKVRRHHGPACDVLPPVEAGDLGGTWSHLVAAALGLPAVDLRRTTDRTDRAGCVGDLADCTADFRDQYYGLEPHVREASACPGGAPLVTTGLVDPAVNAWGRRPTRFLKQQWDAPVVDLESLRGDAALHRWARARLVPKVLVATQGRIIEAVVDVEGTWLPSVPTVTVVPRDTSPWRVLAVLLAPPVAVHAATTYAGSGLTLQAVKLSARQVADLPLPCHDDAWSHAADQVRRAQEEPGLRLEHLATAGRLMCAAYDVPADDVLPWWRRRLR